jgi:hypothetical protein
LKRKYILGALVAVIVLAALVYFYAGSQAPAGQPQLSSLTAQNVVEVKNHFNMTKDDVRMLLLLSPT